MYANTDQFGSSVYTGQRSSFIPVLPNRSFYHDYITLWDPVFQSGSNILLNTVVNAVGQIVPSAGFNLSARIPVESDALLIVANDLNTVLANQGGYYDVNNKWIASLQSTAVGPGFNVLFKTPKLAKYVRINFTSAAKWYVGRRRKGNEQLLKPIYSISFEGDSNTAGFGNFDKSYPTLIREIANCEIYNNALVGRKIALAGGMHETIKNTNYLAQYGVMLGGSNDYTGNVPLGPDNSTNTNEFNGALNAIGAYLVNGRPWQKWYIFSPTNKNYTSPNGIGLLFSDYCNAIENACKRYGITFVDANKELGIDLNQTFVRYIFGSDNIHYNWIGNDSFARYVLQNLLTR